MVLSVEDEPVVISPLGESGRAEWQEFLGRSDNGCLFHDLDFLAYHPPGRFRFHHLVARQRDKLIALIPGGLTADASPVFASPLGASVGGPVIAPRTRTAQGIALVAALQDYAKTEGWAGLQMTLPPPIYSPRTQDLVSFSFFCRGFRLKHRWNCYAIPVCPGAHDRYAKVFHERHATRVRAARRAGITAVEGGKELLEEFVPLFRETYARHRARPTHTAEEIGDLLARFPDRINLVIARKDATPIAGLLVMRLNAHIAYSFYICQATGHEADHGNLVAFAGLLDILGEQGYRWLDTGPGAWDGNFNDGVVFFKESLGGTGHCRDRWDWSLAPA